MPETTGNEGQNSTGAVIKVVGVGGAGLNAVNAMIGAGVRGADFVGVSVTQARLRKSLAASNIRIGTESRFGTGGDPQIARSAVIQTRQAFLDLFQGDRAVRVSSDPRQRLCVQCHAPNAFRQLGSEDDRTPA